jgi:TRAP-type mannitol/chloroaromatic compound transport system permease large subunit
LEEGKRSVKAAIKVIDTFSTWIGIPSSWLIIPLMLITCYDVTARYFFSTAMVCWLFIGSSLFAAVFARLGAQQLESWLLNLGLSSASFLWLSMFIIFLLGWPLEWTEIIVIFVPIFLPLLKTFQVDPLLFGVMVAVNLQTAFLSPPVAMSAFYLKGIAPPHVTLNQIYNGMYPFLIIQLVALFLTWYWPELTLWLPRYLYGE